MKYDPTKHHRRSIRLKGYDYTQPGTYFITICTHHQQCLFGELVESKMQLNQFGQIVRSHWLKLPKYHPHLQLDVFVVMPNHIHGILALTNDVGEGFGNNLSDLSDDSVGAGFGNDLSDLTNKSAAKPAPTNHGIPEIVRGFKTFSSRQINQVRRTSGVPVWQRNYYEHIIRDETALHTIRHYIQTNPANWKVDRLYPAQP